MTAARRTVRRPDMIEIGTKVALLQALMHNDGTCVDLVAAIADATQRRVTLDLGCAYPALRQLEAEGLVAKYRGPHEAVGSGRIPLTYTLTAAGRRQALSHRKALRGLARLALDRGARAHRRGASIS